MQLKELFEIQRTLNERILKEHGLDSSNLRNKKFLALLTEIGELANETRCFKYWSKKGPSPKEIILEEYVDCLHFILTIGLDFGYTDVEPDGEIERSDLSSHFINLFLSVNEMVICASRDSYQVLMEDFISLGVALGFTDEEVTRSYLLKNEENHRRQSTDY